MLHRSSLEPLSLRDALLSCTTTAVAAGSLIAVRSYGLAYRIQPDVRLLMYE